jgi:hypothetical protein
MYTCQEGRARFKDSCTELAKHNVVDPVSGCEIGPTHRRDQLKRDIELRLYNIKKDEECYKSCMEFVHSWRTAAWMGEHVISALMWHPACTWLIRSFLTGLT